MSFNVVWSFFCKYYYTLFMSTWETDPHWKVL